MNCRGTLMQFVVCPFHHAGSWLIELVEFLFIRIFSQRSLEIGIHFCVMRNLNYQVNYLE